MALSFDQARFKALLSGRPARYSVGGIVTVAGVMGTFLLAPSPVHKQVLASSRQLPPGTVLTEADLTWVESGASGDEAVAAGDAASYLGRTLRFGLPAGALLAPGDVGQFPPAGYVKVSLLLKPGQYPQDLVVGQKVGVLPLGADGSGLQAAAQGAAAAAAGGAAAGAGLPGSRTPSNVSANAVSGAIPAELLALAPAPDTQDGMVAELLVNSEQAAQVAAAPSAVLVGTAGAGL